MENIVVYRDRNTGYLSNEIQTEVMFEADADTHYFSIYEKTIYVYKNRTGSMIEDKLVAAFNQDRHYVITNRIGEED